MTAFTPHSGFLRGLFALLASVFLCASCGEEEEPLAPLWQELAELVTGPDGRVTAVVRDNGKLLAVSNRASWGGLKSDTVYRAYVAYVLTGEDEAAIYTAGAVLSSHPAKFREENVLRDPLDVDALWRGGRYLNFTVSLKTGGGSHALAFVDKGISAAADGSQLLRLELYHDQNDDPLYYTRQVSLSCPLYGYADRLFSSRDSVEMKVNTFGGTLVRRFPF